MGPRGVSPREGWTVVASAGISFGAMTVAFQAHNLPWGGIVLWSSIIVLLAGIISVTGVLHRVRRVHPFGYDRALRVALLWYVLVVAVCGWWWIARGPHDASATLTTLTALAATAPTALVGLRLVRAAR